MIMEKSVEWLAGETEVLGEKPAPVPLYPPQTPHACPDAKPGRRGGKPASNRWATARPLMQSLVFSGAKELYEVTPVP
jgi:hypothetical protein